MNSQATTKAQDQTMTPSSPLLPRDAPDNAPKPLSRTAARATALARLLFGAACILAPTFTMRLFAIDVPPGASLLVGLMGTREIVLGELLLTADAAQARGEGKSPVRRILWGVVAVEALDLCVMGMGVARGEVGWSGFGLFSGFVAAALGLAGGALWGY